MHHPTVEQFQALQWAYSYFNRWLFDDTLPEVMLNLSRKNQVAGFVAPFRRRRTETQEREGTVHELSLNPQILTMEPVFVYSTLVHEQCHIRQYEHGANPPAKKTYHNQERATKMQIVGLIPSDTGKPGGKKVGYQMSDYPDPEGRFLHFLKKMPKEFLLPFTSLESDTYVAMKEDPMIAIKLHEAKLKKNKTKYTCPDCKANVRGKSWLLLICWECKYPFEAIVPDWEEAMEVK